MTTQGNDFPGRRVRVLVPLHGGLGLGSERIKARSQDVARKSHEAAARLVKSATETPIASGTSSALPRAGSSASQWLAIAPDGDVETKRTSGKGTAAKTAQASAPGGARNAIAAPVAASVAAHTTRPGETRFRTGNSTAPSARAKGADVTRVHAVCGLALDLVVAGCIVLLSAVLNVTFGAHALGARLAALAVNHGWVASLLGANSGGANPGAHAQWVAFAIQVAFTAAPALFLCQLVSATLLHSTLGRFVLGVEISRAQRGRGAAVAVALAETLAGGGIFALPFVLLTPKRMPLFVWLRLEKGA